jgi:hypothetical protein
LNGRLVPAAAPADNDFWFFPAADPLAASLAAPST